MRRLLKEVAEGREKDDHRESDAQRTSAREPEQCCLDHSCYRRSGEQMTRCFGPRRRPRRVRIRIGCYSQAFISTPPDCVWAYSLYKRE